MHVKFVLLFMHNTTAVVFHDVCVRVCVCVYQECVMYYVVGVFAHFLCGVRM